MGDPFLNYFALGILIFIVVVLFYGIIAIHDIPHIIAKSRNHPHQDAIHAAGWVSLFTLHALWPFLWIWVGEYGLRQRTIKLRRFRRQVSLKNCGCGLHFWRKNKVQQELTRENHIGCFSLVLL